jgi:hypothetical protein
MCTVLLPPGVNRIAVKYIIYHVNLTGGGTVSLAQNPRMLKDGAHLYNVNLFTCYCYILIIKFLYVYHIPFTNNDGTLFKHPIPYSMEQSPS